MELETTYYTSPIGFVKIIGNTEGIQSILLIDAESIRNANSSKTVAEPLQQCKIQLQEYFEGTRKTFHLLLNPQGTEFQKQVWQELLNIPFGKTTTYLRQTKKIGNVKAIRAVAAANGKNPLWIVVPCHRVIGSDGSLTGYAGGIWRKKWLLEHESGIRQETLF